MPTFLILRRVGQTGGRPTSVTAPTLTIGRAARCGLVLKDPLAAEEHARIEWREDGAHVVDLGSVTGVFLEEKPIAGSALLGSGARLTIGRVQMQVNVDAAKQEITLSTIELSQSSERVLSAIVVARRRPFWKKPLHLGVSGLVAAVLPFIVLGVLGQESAFTRGDVIAAHRVDTRAGGSAPVRCDGCHTPWRGAEAQKCAACHTGTVGPASQHPITSAAFAGAGCATCHHEHRGSSTPLAPAHVARETCRSCHVDAHKADVASGRPGGAAGAGSGVAASGGGAAGAGSGAGSGTEVVGRMRRIAFGSFSHQEHIVGRISDCATCHKLTGAAPSTPSATAPAPPTSPRTVTASTAPHSTSVTAMAARDFAPMGYEGCVACHEHEKRAVRDHGTNAQCTACHAGPFEKDMRIVMASLERAPKAALPAQPHGLSASDCARCHMDAKEILAAKARSKPFDHFAHTTTLAPRGPAEVADLVAQCGECHKTVAGASDVGAAVAMPPVGECARCHTGGEIAAGVPSESERREVVAFSHAQHVGPGSLGAPGAPLPTGKRRLSAGAQRLHDQSCLACHDFGEDAPGARPHLAGAKEDCAKCHTKRHEDAGLADCAFCHVGPDDLFEPKPLSRPDYGPIRFNHAGKTHATVKCDVCHADASKAKDLSQLSYPRFSSPVCQSCHAAKDGGDLDCYGCHKMHQR